jgi:ABC-type transport system substrate-binding protein
MPNHTEVLMALKSYYEAVGIAIHPKLIEQMALQTMVIKRDPNLVLCLVNYPGARDPAPRLKITIQSGGVYAQYQSRKDLDELIEKQKKTVDEKERLGILHKIYHILHEDPAFINLFGLHMIYATNDRI